ncbi:MAG: hypothetical protein KDA78_19700 [Planctomycetaceae bacterium]|nr:hypothetical protein [Planctomycetaceae bacterium]
MPEAEAGEQEWDNQQQFLQPGPFGFFCVFGQGCGERVRFIFPPAGEFGEGLLVYVTHGWLGVRWNWWI